MFDEFFYRRRKNKSMLILMIGCMLLGAAMIAAGFLFLR